MTTPARHLVAVWDPTLGDGGDPMDAHVALLLHQARSARARAQAGDGGLDDDDVYVWWGKLASPRRREPRLAVPAGSVGIGDEQTGIYPAVLPGGWQLIGHTDIALFVADRDPPSLLAPGDTVRFVAEEIIA